MKKISILLLVFIFFILSTCTRSRGQITRTQLVNNSGYLIRINFFRSGMEVEEESYNIIDGESKVVFIDDESDGGGSMYTVYLDIFDSLTITFAESKSITQYDFMIQGNSLGFNFEESRNLFNKNNYTKKILIDTKKNFEAEYTYTFTGQDYLNAN